MNQLKKCTAIKSVLLLAVFFTATVAQAAGVGTVTHLSGPLLAKKANGTVRVLGMKSAVEAGDTLSTQSKGYAQIKFSDGSALILQPDTVLTIDKFSYDAAKPASDNIAYTLVQGGVRSNAGALGKRSKDSVQMVTPMASISMQAANVVVQYIKPDQNAVAAARAAYLLASTAALDGAMQTTRSDMPLPFAIQPLLLAQVNVPLPSSVPGSPGAMAPGLYVQVIDGLIHLTNQGGTANFAAGQFGYTASVQKPPVVVPQNPGIQFNPPPVFSSSSPPSNSSTATKSNNVDCEVR